MLVMVARRRTTLLNRAAAPPVSSHHVRRRGNRHHLEPVTGGLAMPVEPCPDCGNKVSTLASACPNCGRPMGSGAVPPPAKDFSEEYDLPANGVSVEEAQRKQAQPAQIGCLVIIIVGALFYFLGNSPKGSSGPQSPRRPSSSTAAPAPPPRPAGPRLEYSGFNWSISHSYATVNGRVTNITDQRLENVMAVVSFFDSGGQFITSDDALIDYNPLLPGQTAPFTVMARANPAMASARLEFKELMGGTIEAKEK